MPDSFQLDDEDTIFNEAVAHAKKKKIGDLTPEGDLTPPFENFLRQLVFFATGEDYLWADPHALLDRATQAWMTGAVRKPDEHVVNLRVVDGNNWRERRLVLDITTRDRPFLVDSISAALSDAGKPVSFFANTVLEVQRDDKGERVYDGGLATNRESVIHAEMDPPVDSAETTKLADEIGHVLDDVNAAVSDWEPMRARLGSCIAQLENTRPIGVNLDEHLEAIALLKWLWDNRFAFLGVRRFSYSKNGDDVVFEHDPTHDLGILRDHDRRVLRSTFDEHGALSPAVSSFLESKEPIIVAKANSRSLVHRRVHMDYIGVKSFSVDGRVTGEERFVGLFTAEAYNRPASDIPLMRAKIQKVLQKTPFSPGGYNEKALINILETFPRDELFQVDADELRETCLGILRLFKRPRVKLFLRRDRFDRFISALVFVPRDRFNSEIREQIGEYLASTFEGRVSSFSPFFGDAALVRVHFIIGLNPGAPEGPGTTTITRYVRSLCRQWTDDLLEALRVAHNGATPVGLFAKYVNAFSEGYKEHCDADEALIDIGALERLTERAFSVRAFRRGDDTAQTVRLKIYRRGEPLRLSDVIPVLENLGLSVVQEAGYQIRPDGDAAHEDYHIHDFLMADRRSRDITLGDVKTEFEEALTAILDGKAEDDGFNSLVLAAGLNWREVAMMRAVAKYSLQAGIQYSQQYIEEALSKHGDIARQLVAVFHARFNVNGAKSASARIDEFGVEKAGVVDSLADVSSLDEDRIIRRYLNFFEAVVRTNYYQQTASGEPKPYISFKIDSCKVDDLPDPKPFREIFVSGPRVDGVHLRFGPVSRGGLRWSDRREDFRTEVLGLVKAQRVKNAVIVPTGSKGGFYPKQLPQTSDRAAIYEAGREAYKEFIRGLLDLTDNIVEGKTLPPENVVMWDDEDPYLVVAADKGTAQFSDTANAISNEYGFWLGDAFASGGSAGYDHKVMGITARGAWEAVKRHFREIGKDIQSEPFTAVGVGDMSGDVFGNGMLLSTQTKLIAAFDHRDVFIDPNPDPATSYEERKRLFELPRSSWQDYDKEKISKGGGVFSRSAKSVSLTPAIKKALGITQSRMTPNDLIQAILRAPVELFWLGGIGTYFKSHDEDNTGVGDRANDSVRINADEMRVKVIGEGANLGLTQLARIEFARRGGRVNTDAIDNSAGVDSSDHEVNIKILLSNAIERAELKTKNRDALLASMTEDVAAHVLRHNYEQTRAITQLEATADIDIDAHARFMARLEKVGRLDREIENLPDDEAINALKQSDTGLTRPELSVLLAYSKLWLFDELVASSAPDDPTFEQELFCYFPEALSGFTGSITHHQLRREIIATRLSNEIVDTCGITFAQRVAEVTGANFAEVTLAYEAARRIYELNDFADAIDGLDNEAPADLQTELHSAASNLLREQVFRLLASQDIRAMLTNRGVKYVTDRYHAPVGEFKVALRNVMSTKSIEALETRREEWLAKGASEELAEFAAGLPVLERAFDIVDLAAETGWSNPGVGSVFFAVGRLFGIDIMREKARHEPPDEHYDKVATRQLVEDLATRQVDLTKSIIEYAATEPKGEPGKWAEKAVAAWTEAHSEATNRFNAFSQELDIAGRASVGKMSLLNKKLTELTRG